MLNFVVPVDLSKPRNSLNDKSTRSSQVSVFWMPCKPIRASIRLQARSIINKSSLETEGRVHFGDESLWGGSGMCQALDKLH